MYRVWQFVTEYSLLLIFGAVIALIWANVDYQSYSAFTEYELWEDAPIGHHSDGARTLTLQYLVNNMLMALFFAIAAKEVWEAVILKNGSLRGKKAATPLIATIGGMAGPVTVYLVLAALLGSDTYDAIAHGWAVPTATDIAFSYLVGRIVFGAGHPAVRFLLLLAIADDAAGLVILAVFYPAEHLRLEWLILSAGAAFAAFALFNWLPRHLDAGQQERPNSTRIRRSLGGLPYVVAGCASWYGFMRSGLHPALGLLPIIPAIPHADRAFGIFAETDRHLKDLLNVMEHALSRPVEIVLFLFGLMNAGVTLEAIGAATWPVLAGLMIGKPVGILAFGWLAAKPMGLGISPGMRIVDLAIVGFVAAIGFTVSLFIATVAFPPGDVQDAAKMGALLSFCAAAIAIVFGRLAGVQKIKAG